MRERGERAGGNDDVVAKGDERVEDVSESCPAPEESHEQPGVDGALEAGTGKLAAEASGRLAGSPVVGFALNLGEGEIAEAADAERAVVLDIASEVVADIRNCDRRRQTALETRLEAALDIADIAAVAEVVGAAADGLAASAETLRSGPRCTDSIAAWVE